MTASPKTAAASKSKQPAKREAFQARSPDRWETRRGRLPDLVIRAQGPSEHVQPTALTVEPN
ncbi:MAG: hypothetical protein ABSF26_10970 [Thermoguttaceae bacterium]